MTEEYNTTSRRLNSFYWNTATGPNSSNDKLKLNVEINCNGYFMSPPLGTGGIMSSGLSVRPSFRSLKYPLSTTVSPLVHGHGSVGPSDQPWPFFRPMKVSDDFKERERVKRARAGSTTKIICSRVVYPHKRPAMWKAFHVIVTGSYWPVIYICYMFVDMLSVIPVWLPSNVNSQSVDGSGYRLHSFIFWPLVALTTSSRALDFDSRRVARIVPMTPGFSSKQLCRIGNFTIRIDIILWFNVHL